MNKKVGLLLMACLMATALALASCGGTNLEEFAREYIAAEDKAWAQGDTSDLAELEDPDIVIHMHNLGFDLEGWEAHEQIILDTRGIITDMQQEWEYLTGEGNHFAMAYNSSSTIPGETPDITLDVTNSSLFVFRIDDGRVVEMWVNGSNTMTPRE